MIRGTDRRRRCHTLVRLAVSSRGLGIRPGLTWGVPFAGMAVACLLIAASFRRAREVDTEPPLPSAERVPWPPDMRVAPPPPDAPPPDTWPQLEVTVRDPGGALVPGAAVQVWVDGRGCIGRSFGKHHFRRPDVVDSPDGRDTWLSGAAYTGADGVATLRVPTGTGTHLVARDASGRIALMRFGQDQCMSPCVTSGDCGSCTLGAPCTDHRPVSDCSAPRQLILQLAEPVEVSGRVVDEDARPVAGARVIPTPRQDHLYARWTAEPWVEGSLAIDEWSRVSWGAPHEDPMITDVSGRFAMQVAQRGSMELVVVAPRHLMSERQVEVFDRPMNVELRTVRAARLVMRVIDNDGEPVAGAYVYCCKSDSEAAMTDSAGRLVVNGIAGGLHTFWVQADGFAPREIAMFAGDREMPIRLEPVPHVRVDLSASRALVSSLGDRPLVDVRLVAPGDPPEPIYSEQRVGSAELAPDGSGLAVIEKVPPGEYTIWVTWRGGLVRGPIVRVRDETPVAAHVRLAGEASLDGSIRERVDGRLRDVRWYSDLWVMDGSRRIGTRALVENGRYYFPVLPAGRWLLRSRRSRRIEIRPGANRRDLIVRSSRRD